MRWDGRLASYVAELRLFPGLGRGPSSAHDSSGAAARSADTPATLPPHAVREASYLWCFETFDSYLPTHLVIGHRPAEFITVDALANHLSGRSLALSPTSCDRLVQLRYLVEDQWGEVVIIGRVTADRPRSDGAPTDRRGLRLSIGRPGGGTIDVMSRLADPAYAFDCGAPTPGTLQTARAIIELAWSTSWSGREELLAAELATEFLLSAPSGFVLPAASVADWIVTDVPLRFRSTTSDEAAASASSPFRQLALGFG